MARAREYAITMNDVENVLRQYEMNWGWSASIHIEAGRNQNGLSGAVRLYPIKELGADGEPVEERFRIPSNKLGSLPSVLSATVQIAYLRIEQDKWLWPRSRRREIVG